jgi:A/G-specific adenine glycosylase
MTAIRRRPSGDIWEGLWEPLLQEGNSDFPNVQGTFTLLHQGVKHVLTHQIIYADFFVVETTKKPKLNDSFIWIPESDLSHYALPRLVERLIASI